MGLQEVWTEQGIFDVEDGTPIRLTHRITVPSRPSLHEMAAMVELAGRIGLHCIQLQRPIIESLFIFDVLDGNRAVFGVTEDGDLGEKLRLVVGYDDHWLATVIGERASMIRELKVAQAENDKNGTGLIYSLRDDSGTILVITGTTPKGVLLAARHLARDKNGRFSSGMHGGEASSYLVVSPVPDLETGTLNASRAQVHSLHEAFTERGIFQVFPGEIYPTLNVSFVVEEVSEPHMISMVEMAVRMALSAGNIVFPLTSVEETIRESAVVIRLQSDDSIKKDYLSLGGASRDELNPHPTITVGGPPTRLVSWVRYILENQFGFPEVPQNRDWRAKFTSLRSLARDIQERAQLDLMLTSELSLNCNITGVTIPEHIGSDISHWTSIRMVEQRNIHVDRPAMVPVWEKAWKHSGELADMTVKLHDWFEAHHSQACGKNGPIGDDTGYVIDVWTTVTEEVFGVWAQETQNSLHGQTGTHIQLLYHNADKAGLHWLLGEVLPELQNLPQLHAVELAAKSFEPSDDHLDLRHRFLQELFPADEILSRELNLDLSNIRLSLESDSAMFTVRAFDETHEQIGQWQMDGWVQSLTYMPQFPELGCVAVPMAGCQISKGSDVLDRITIEPNPLLFWKWYQTEVVTALPTLVDENAGVPKFLRLECDVYMNAPEHRLGFREEATSALEALHEDIYFYTLHALQLYGKSIGDTGWDAPGAILPFVHTSAKPHASAVVRVYALPESSSLSLVFNDGTTLQLLPKAAQVFQDAWISEVARTENGNLEFQVEGLSDAELHEKVVCWLQCTVPVCLVPHETLSATAAMEKDLQLDVLQNEDVWHWLEARQRKLPGRVRQIDHSFAGEPICLVELFDGYGSPTNTPADLLTDSVKHSLYKPTLFINARHHANEVSSTNAALLLIEQLMHDPSLLRRMNVVIIPLQNVDGANIHAKMLKEHPFWKLHAARYSACGLEFSRYYFRPDAPFGESRTYQTVWQSWRPDIFLDDHGIPSHEWIQPFSGYSSPPQFPVSYWIPIARMYTIWNELDGETFEGAKSRASIRSKVSRYLEEDIDIARENQRRLALFQKWGHAFEPKLFPVELTNGNITYTWNAVANAESTTPLERFPQWITADIISEVNDETVHGSELNDCIHAHHVVHKGLLDWLYEVQPSVSVYVEPLTDEGVRVGIVRDRPIQITSSNE